ncbi:uncharacterized protein LOC141612829 [Silene latifolia]|uniref:uncharacterized protein LOC141612829 n=1 Tax=Silene latifolia TaxID=37657 RepID=UPI003D770BE1
MSFKKSIQKTKKFLHKTLKNLKKFPFEKHGNLPRTLFINPLSCMIINQKVHQHDLPIPCDVIEHSNQSLPDKSSFINLANDTTKDDHKTAIVAKIEPSSVTSSCRYTNEGSFSKLANKMKELEMMEVEDEEQDMDVEDALNYYSQLSCPVYVDIVDKFFADMYQEYVLPQPSVSLRSLSSSRRLGPLKL